MHRDLEQVEFLQVAVELIYCTVQDVLYTCIVYFACGRYLEQCSSLLNHYYLAVY